MNTTYSKGVAYCLLAAIAFGGAFPVMNSALVYLDPFNFTTIRYAITAVMFALLLFFREGTAGFRLNGGRWLLAWIFGTPGFAGFGFLVFLGQYLAGAAGALTASVMMATMPMLGLLTIWALKKIRPSVRSFCFILLSFSGVLLVISNGHPAALLHSSVNITANLLLIAGALCWVVYTIGGSYFADWSTLRYTTITTLTGLISMLVTDALLMAGGAVAVPHITSVMVVIPHLLYMALVAGVLAVWLWNKGNNIITANNGVLFMNMVPVTAFSVSALQGVVPSLVQITGAALTVSALILNNLNQRKRATAKARAENKLNSD